MRQNDEASVREQLANGANPNCRNSKDLTPLHLAAFYYHGALTKAKETDNRVADAPPLTPAELVHGFNEFDAYHLRSP